MVLYLLHEAASGYGLFEVTSSDETNQSADAVQQAYSDMSRFGKMVKLSAFMPFTTAQNALDNINAITEGHVTDDLKAFLETNLPKVSSKKEGKKASAFQLGVYEAALGSEIKEKLSVACVCNEYTGELMRGVKLHFPRFMKDLSESDIHRAQLGLAHAFSRAKVKFNVKKVDNMIIQAIALLDTLDKDVNTFVMRVREWYGWHFPELVKIVNDNYQYARIVVLVKDKGSVTDEMLPALTEITLDEGKSQEVVEAAKISMGQDISPIDLINIEAFARMVINLAEYRQKLHTYLDDKMHTIAPNLFALIGEVVGARLISHAGSLVNLAKYPASTVQILGAEKALFRALKTKGNTPKYGLIFHSSFIGKAKQRNKGRISRYLANKCSIASRIDAFMDSNVEGSDAFGRKLKEQVEERLRFYDEGVAPKKNITAMQEVIKSMGGVVNGDAAGKKKKDGKKDKDSKKEEKKEEKKEDKKASSSSGKDKKEKKRAVESDEEEEEPAAKKSKKEKKDKKDKK